MMGLFGFKRKKAKKSLISDKDYHFLPEPEACRGKHHEDFTKKEAKLMFEWWVGEVPKKTEYLFDYVNQFIDLPLEYDLETFKKLVDYLPHMITIRKLSSEEYENKKLQLPPMMWDNLNDWEFTRESNIIILWVAGYLGTIMIKETPGTCWKLDTAKSSVNYNRPYISFPNGLRLEVINISEVIARRIVRKADLKLDSMIEAWKRKSKLKIEK